MFRRFDKFVFSFSQMRDAVTFLAYFVRQYGTIVDFCYIVGVAKALVCRDLLD